MPSETSTTRYYEYVRRDDKPESQTGKPSKATEGDKER